MGTELTFKTKPHLCTDNEPCRYSLSDIQLIPKEGGAWAVATDGRQLVVVPVEGKCDKTQRMPASILSPPKQRGEMKVTLDGDRWHLPGHADRAAEGKFPDVPKLLGKIDVSNRVAFCIDPALLSKIAAAINDGIENRAVTLLIDTQNRHEPIAVIGTGGGIAALMQMESYGGDTNESDRKIWQERIDAYLADCEAANGDASAPKPPRKKPAKSKK